MKRSRLIGSTTLALAALIGSSLYMSHPAKSSDHQDTYNLGNAIGHNTTADITDVFVFPSPSNPANVVLAMDTAPLTPASMGTAAQYTFDPTLLYQFKISHDAMGKGEDQVIQFTATGTGASQTINVYGPVTPHEVGTSNTVVTAVTPVTIPFNPTVAQSAVTINGSPAFVFAGPRADPFNFDLFAFFSFLGDRNFQTHASQTDAGTLTPLGNGDNTGTAGAVAPSYDKPASRASAPSFNGFASGTMSNTSTKTGTGYACVTSPANNALTDYAGGFNVESLIIEVPKSLLTVGGVSTIHVWATVSSSTVQS